MSGVRNVKSSEGWNLMWWSMMLHNQSWCSISFIPHYSFCLALLCTCLSLTSPFPVTNIASFRTPSLPLSLHKKCKREWVTLHEYKQPPVPGGVWREYDPNVILWKSVTTLNCHLTAESIMTLNCHPTGKSVKTLNWTRPGVDWHGLPRHDQSPVQLQASLAWHFNWCKRA